MTSFLFVIFLLLLILFIGLPVAFSLGTTSLLSSSYTTFR